MSDTGDGTGGGGLGPPDDGWGSEGGAVEGGRGFPPPREPDGQDGFYIPPPTGQPGADYPGGGGWQPLAGGEVPGHGPGQVPASRSGRGTFTVLRVVAVVAILFGGAIWGYFTSADRGDDGAISKAGDLDVMSLQVGDCFDDPGDTEEVDSIRAIPCGQPHDNEVILNFELPEGDALPSRQVIDEQIGQRCLPAFDEFVGVAYEDSELDLFTFEPTAGSWREGDRTITCAVYDLSGEKLVGTARGVGR